MVLESPFSSLHKIVAAVSFKFTESIVGTSQLVHTFLKRGERIKKETRNSRVGRASSDYGNRLKLVSHSPMFPNSKGEGTRLPSHDTRNKQAKLPPYISKTPSNHAESNILLSGL